MVDDLRNTLLVKEGFHLPVIKSSGTIGDDRWDSRTNHHGTDGNYGYPMQGTGRINYRLLLRPHADGPV